jgi:SPOR domain
MDQDNTKGQDKRNWRERLGVGAAGSKDLPKISDDYRKEQAPMAARPIGATKVAPRPVAPAAGVKPAPMAPRANPKPIPPVSPEKLAERLRSQRDASARMAEQRVQVARQRSEVAAPVAPPRAAAPTPPPQVAPANAAPKPKFTFAEEGQAKPAAAAPPPMTQRPAAPQIAPARPPLGGQVAQPGFPPRAPQQQFAPPPAYVPPQQPQTYAPNYGQQPVPPYRPIDPATGYAPQQQYSNPPPRNFAPPPSSYAPQNNGPRLNVPARPTVGAGYGAQQGYGAGPLAAEPRMPRPQIRPIAPQLPEGDEYQDEYYGEAPAPRTRRPSTNDYQQAYREAEGGYEDDVPRSRTPLILASLLLLTLAVAGTGVWLYQKSFKPMLTGQTTSQDVPAVAAPETPAKVQPEQTTQAPAVATPTKKQIYDRIVGDQEILGGELAPVEEVPAQVPEPAPAAGSTPQPATGEDAAPLPIPPPPGAADQQGSLKIDTEKQSAENITPAAGESQAAVASSGVVPDVPTQQQADIPAVAPVAPAPGEQPPAQVASSTDAGTETISEPDPAPIVKKKIVTPPKKKAVAEKADATKNLGSKPVVLVPPAKKTKSSSSQTLDTTDVASVSNAEDNNGGLYGDATVAAPIAEVKPAAPAAGETKKKKTLADLFNGNANEPADIAANDLAAEAPLEPVAKPVAPIKKPASVAQAPLQQQAALGSNGFAVQLASFRTRNEATTEFGRLKAKHGAALGGLSPIVSEAIVGGSTRYRLSVGTLASREQANAVCSKLFAAGERDCLVKKQ